MNTHATNSRKTLAFMFLALCFTMLGPAHAHAAVAKIELAGPDRFATAVDVSQEGWPGGAATVAVATGLNWPDALGGAALAGELDAPLLLVRQDSIPAVVWAEINRLNPSAIHILGGDNAVGPAVEAQLASKVGAANIYRFEGADRYQTSNAIATGAITFANLTGVYDGHAFVATGANFPDALAAGPVAANFTWPIFLANPADDTVPAAYMKALGVTDVMIVGGTSVVSLNQQSILEAEFPGHVSRRGAANRYATAEILSHTAVDNWGMSWTWSALATGEQYPDALAGGIFLGKKRNGVMLTTPTDSLYEGARFWYNGNLGSISTLYCLGGTSALSQEVRDEVALYFP